MIYLYHIQRTGGRSFTQSMLAEFPNPINLWQRCHGKTGEGPIIEEQGKKILPWHGNPMTVCDDFFYGWSHLPVHRFELPRRCFTLTILRDPVTRFISMYRYVRKFDMIDAPRTPGHINPHLYLRDTILETANAFPPIHRYQMLYHFSAKLDVEEAVERIGGLSYWFRMENYAQGLEDLRGRLGLKLPWRHAVDGNIPDEVETRVRAELTPRVRAELVTLFQPEYKLLEALGG